MGFLQRTNDALIGRPSAMGARAAAVVLLAALALGTESGRAAVLRLRSECRSRGPVVTLGDVAEVLTADAEQARALSVVELFPAPVAPRQRFVRLREIQDILLSRGIDLTEHQFSGSSQVTILAAGGPPEGDQQRPLSSSTIRTASHRVVDGVVQYLREYVSANEPWVVEAELDPSLARLITRPGQDVSVAGGSPPWTGLQRFEVAIEGPQGTERFLLDAQVGVLPPVVVAARDLPRGTVVRAEDVELQSAASADDRSGRFGSLDEVIGKETTRAIPKGKVLRQESVGLPVLVRRGDVVTVYARNPGICVRTLGRARDSGSLGELVAVESIEDRSTYYARVSSVREVEVFGQSARADHVDTGGRY
jgi:flagella basal body P-ring formation protein FlgA